MVNGSIASLPDASPRHSLPRNSRKAARWLPGLLIATKKGPVMRLVWTVMFALASSAAFAASPEDDYIAARDKAIAAIAALNSANAPVETLDAADAKARTDLEARLSAILGPLAVKDFPATGTINLESLSDADV